MLSESADILARCAAQLYDEWGGYYVLRKLYNGAWWDVRQLDRSEAMTYRPGPDEALELRWITKGA